MDDGIHGHHDPGTDAYPDDAWQEAIREHQRVGTEGDAETCQGGGIAVAHTQAELAAAAAQTLVRTHDLERGVAV
ncbi:hypothetical protein N7513_007584 [Penicillium frequentans]|nr:hypothetical protein N7513_007584 [Penicillium glabrum]